MWPHVPATSREKEQLIQDHNQSTALEQRTHDLGEPDSWVETSMDSPSPQEMNDHDEQRDDPSLSEHSIELSPEEEQILQQRLQVIRLASRELRSVVAPTGEQDPTREA